MLNRLKPILSTVFDILVRSSVSGFHFVGTKLDFNDDWGHFFRFHCSVASKIDSTTFCLLHANYSWSNSGFISGLRGRKQALRFKWWRDLLWLAANSNSSFRVLKRFDLSVREKDGAKTCYFVAKQIFRQTNAWAFWLHLFFGMLNFWIENACCLFGMSGYFPRTLLNFRI